jgi:hypothetical protein
MLEFEAVGKVFKAAIKTMVLQAEALAVEVS